MPKYSDIMHGVFASDERVAAYTAAKKNPNTSQFFTFDGDLYEVRYTAGDPPMTLGGIELEGSAGKWREFHLDEDGKKSLQSIKNVIDDQG